MKNAASSLASEFIQTKYANTQLTTMSADNHSQNDESPSP